MAGKTAKGGIKLPKITGSIPTTLKPATALFYTRVMNAIPDVGNKVQKTFFANFGEWIGECAGLDIDKMKALKLPRLTGIPTDFEGATDAYAKTMGTKVKALTPKQYNNFFGALQTWVGKCENVVAAAAGQTQSAGA